MNIDNLKREFMLSWINELSNEFFLDRKNMESLIKATNLFVNKVLELENKNLQVVNCMSKETLVVQYIKKLPRVYNSLFVSKGASIISEAEGCIRFAENFLQTMSSVVGNGSFIIDNI